MTGHFTVPWASGALLKKVIDAMTAPRRHHPDPTSSHTGDDTHTGAAFGAGADAPRPAATVSDATTPSDSPTGADPFTGTGRGALTTRWDEIDWQQRRGMALADLLLDIPTDHLSPKIAATLIVTTRLHDLRDDLRKVSTTDLHDTISAGTTRRLACNAGIIPAVLDGDTLPLDLGRQKRLHTQAQRVALATRYTECAADGCDRPFAWCEAHHLQAWEAGGNTDLANAAPLCGQHHRMIDAPHWTHHITHLPDGTVTITFHRRT
ncbi:hypothetical protein GCM10022199_16530 [Marihabitans asiaticum]|uniref:HNH endonuclease signature motif containing protein n=1 Tax=Marihabitans asiaticum TaxID=415218 RepID=UPI0011A8E240|nr:HNH endonuclease signature motif containing protein [Marihabitans asiaticum]